MSACPSLLVPYVIDSLSHLVYIRICFLLQSPLAMVISLDLSLLCSCRLQIVEYICVDNAGALKHLLVEIDYNWHLWEKSQWLFSICSPSGKSLVGSYCSFFPSVHAWAFHFPEIGKDFLVLIFSFPPDLWGKRCSGTLEVTVASLQGEGTLLCWTKWLDLKRFWFNRQMPTNLCFSLPYSQLCLSSMGHLTILFG